MREIFGEIELRNTLIVDILNNIEDYIRLQMNHTKRAKFMILSITASVIVLVIFIHPHA